MKFRFALPALGAALLTTTLAAQVTVTLTPAQADALRAVLQQLVPTPPPPPPPPPPSGASVTVPAGGDVQKALDSVPDGGTVYLTQAVTYTTNLTFRKRAGSVTLRTSGLDDTAMPPGVRVGPVATPTVVSKMAKIVCRDCLADTIGFEFGAHDVSVIGIEVIGNPAHIDRTTITLGVDANSNLAPTVADLPSNITFDRIYVHADNGGHLGIRLDGRNANVLESDIRGFVEQGRDSQAIAVFNGSGPFLIRNNYLEASGENFMMGGSDPQIPNLVPSDLTFIGNYCFKPLAWKSKPGSVKNLFELKNAARAKVDGNVFENNWADAQPGIAIVLTTRNQDGGCPWCVVRDVTFSNNVVKNNLDNYALNLLGMDSEHASVVGSNLVVTNNLFLNVSKGAQILAPLRGLELGHNTFIGITGQFIGFGANAAGAVVTGLNVHDNVASLGAYGITGDGTGVGTPSLTVYAPTFKFVKNLLEASAERAIPVPTGNYAVAAKQLGSKVDPTWKVIDATLTASDGGLVGVDVTKLPATSRPFGA
jgi:hypothetical protein